jgi:hypothetical protein
MSTDDDKPILIWDLGHNSGNYVEALEVRLQDGTFSDETPDHKFIRMATHFTDVTTAKRYEGHDAIDTAKAQGEDIAVIVLCGATDDVKKILPAVHTENKGTGIVVALSDYSADAVDALIQAGAKEVVQQSIIIDDALRAVVHAIPFDGPAL